MTKDEIDLEINRERTRQTRIWGVQNHKPEVWCLILGEEVGEVQKAVLENRFDKKPNYLQYREELIQVAAVAKAMIECLDREAASDTKGGADDK